MTWERDPLWAKARLFFERALSCESRNDLEFGLWCSFGLEFLARSALASISPTLLADPDKDHKNLLYALNRGSEENPKSLAATHVFFLCGKLFPEFLDEDLKACLALTNRRNKELHSGADAFGEYQTNQWLVGFYHACDALCKAMGESLANLFDEEEAGVATEMLKSEHKDLKKRVHRAIATHKKVFEDKAKEERQGLKQAAEERGKVLAFQRHHRVSCPACGCVATIQGKPFGKQQVRHGDGEIVVRQPVSPSTFSCDACGLKFKSYAELSAAGLGGHYTRKTTYSPEEYYGLIDPDDIPPEIIESYVQEYLENLKEYDNE